MGLLKIFIWISLYSFATCISSLNLEILLINQAKTATCNNDDQCTSGSSCEYIHETNESMCITEAFYNGYCVYDEQCKLTDDHLYCTESGFCNCESEYAFYSFKRDDQCRYHYRPHKYAKIVGIVIGLMVLLPIGYIIFLAYPPKSNRNQRLGQNHPTSNGNESEFESVNLDNVNITSSSNLNNMNSVIFAIENPPCYGDIHRCETPPPTFEDSIQTKSELSGALYLVNDNYTGGDSHIQFTDHEHGKTNTAYENDAPS